MNKGQYADHLKEMNTQIDSFILPSFGDSLEKYVALKEKCIAINKDCQYRFKYKDSAINQAGYDILTRLEKFNRNNNQVLMHNYALALRDRLSTKYGFDIIANVVGEELSLMNQHFSDASYREEVYKSYKDHLKKMGFIDLKFYDNYSYPHVNSYERVTSSGGYTEYYTSYNQPYYGMYIVDSEGYYRAHGLFLSH